MKRNYIFLITLVIGLLTIGVVSAAQNDNILTKKGNIREIYPLDGDMKVLVTFEDDSIMTFSNVSSIMYQKLIDVKENGVINILYSQENGNNYIYLIDDIPDMSFDPIWIFWPVSLLIALIIGVAIGDA